MTSAQGLECLTMRDAMVILAVITLGACSSASKSGQRPEPSMLRSERDPTVQCGDRLMRRAECDRRAREHQRHQEAIAAEDALQRGQERQAAEEQRLSAERKTQQAARDVQAREDARQMEEARRAEEAVEESRLAQIQRRCGQRFNQPPRVGTSFERWRDCLAYPDDVYLDGQQLVRGRPADLYGIEGTRHRVWVIEGDIVAWD